MTARPPGTPLTTPLTGGCLCDGVRFEITAEPVVASYCHCGRCQKRTGTAASVSMRIAPGSLRIVSGEDLIRAFDAGSGGFLKAFCSSCGGALWSQSPENPEVRSVRLGTFDSDPGIRPSYRQFVAYAAPWEPIPNDGLPRYAERIPS
ncbi:MAG: GFA family protein [Gaiellaceae bacterium]